VRSFFGDLHPIFRVCFFECGAILRVGCRLGLNTFAQLFLQRCEQIVHARYRIERRERRSGMIDRAPPMRLGLANAVHRIFDRFGPGRIGCRRSLFEGDVEAHRECFEKLCIPGSAYVVVR